MATPETPDDMARRLAATIEVGATDDSAERILNHLRWEFAQILMNIDPMRLSARDLLGLLGILVPIHADFLGDIMAGPKQVLSCPRHRGSHCGCKLRVVT